MTWFRIDDDIAFHRKTLRAGNAAMGAWLRAGGEVAHQLLDGFCPDDLARTIATATEIRRLVEVGLWHRKADVRGCTSCVRLGLADVAAKAEGEGFMFHEWTDRNPLRCEVEARREKRAAAGRAGGQAKAANARRGGGT